jgi:thiamine pyrophosphate-dependent acetolactate synthase large subunit-like protein
VDFGPDGRLNPRAVVAALDRILPAERSVVMDGGHFIGWAPMYLSVPDPHAIVLVGTAFQSIGLGFGSAAGVSAARPERTTVLVSGDGGALMGWPTSRRSSRQPVGVWWWSSTTRRMARSCTSTLQRGCTARRC